MSSLIEELEKLTEALDSFDYKDLKPGAALEVTDLSSQADEFLSDKAKAALSRSSKSLTHKDDTGSYTCIYLGAILRNQNLLGGLKSICNDLNSLAEKDLIHSTLAKPSSVKLARVPLQDEVSAVFSYVLVPENKMEEAQSLVTYAISEGDCGKPWGSLEQDLKEGEFLASISVSVFSSIHSERKSEAILHEEIQNLLNILPKGTEIISITPCSVISLSIPYEVKFRNPLMNNYKEVRLEYTRECVRLDDKIEQFSLLTGVEYVKKES